MPSGACDGANHRTGGGPRAGMGASSVLALCVHLLNPPSLLLHGQVCFFEQGLLLPRCYPAHVVSVLVWGSQTADAK